MQLSIQGPIGVVQSFKIQRHRDVMRANLGAVLGVHKPMIYEQITFPTSRHKNAAEF